MSSYKRFITKGSNLNVFNNISDVESIISGNNGTFEQNYPLTSSISVEFYPNQANLTSSQYGNPDRKRLKTLKSLYRKYRKYSDFFEYSSSYYNLENDDICLINIPSIFYGESISKGSVEINFYKNGVLLSSCRDLLKNGELLQTTGSVQLNNKNVAGVVMYNEGLIILFDNTPLDTYKENFYSYTNVSTIDDFPRWSNWGITANTITGTAVTTSYGLNFTGVNQIPQLTLFAHAPKGELNFSTNYTFVSYDSSSAQDYRTGSYYYGEKENIELKNITKTPYLSPTASFHKETYISKILIYDENKKVIGIAKLAKPVRKTEERDFTFKLKLDI
jgi:hypothetical protein